jgi:hypothetical protein
MLLRGKVFISYRREDTEHFAQSLCRALAQHLPKYQFFIDTQNLEPGSKFREEIEQKLQSCNTLVAVIGERWLSPRLKESDDLLCFEIATALKRNIRVVPVLVNRAKMPKPSDLPSSLETLPDWTAIEVRSSHWDSDVQILISVLKGLPEKTEAEQNQALADLIKEERKAHLLEDERKASSREGIAVRKEIAVFKRIIVFLIAFVIVAILVGGVVLFTGRVLQSPGPAPDAGPQAVENLEHGANAGDTNAMLNLGEIYNAQSRDPVKAVAWYEKAAAAGNSVGMARLARMYVEGRGVSRDPAKGREWLEKAAAAGDSDVMYFLGYMYESGDRKWGVMRDYAKAREWYQKAAAAGDWDAKDALVHFR